MNKFFDHLILTLAIAFILWLFYDKSHPAKQANNTVPYWYTIASSMKKFDYASQSNYAQEAFDYNGY